MSGGGGAETNSHGFAESRAGATAGGPVGSA